MQTRYRLTLSALLTFAAWASASAAPAQDSAMTCAALARTPLDLAAETTAHIMAAEMIDVADGRAAQCRVTGYVAPNTQFQMVLPADRWNGKFFYAGCTGSCGIAGGSVWTRECEYPVAKGYACIISDMGHRSTPADGLWAWRNLEAKVDFAFRATHRTALAGKAIIAAFYGERPKHSYFMGCSTGGRQALLSAQRFPQDFDGIIAGAPVVSEAGTSMSFVWTLKSLARPDGSPIFDDRSLKRLHDGAVAALDRADGRRDGVIDDPRRAFDPASLDLSDEQVAAARKVYAGPADSKGRPVYFGGGFLPGSEMGWRSFLAIGGPAQATRSGTDTTRFIQSDFGPGWDATAFDFDRDPDRLREYEIFYSASNPDLRAFRDAGGKLLIYHGWADARVAPLNSVDYYAAVARAMGGADETRGFARLVMVPGMEHCWGGDGPFAIDYIGVMEAWVERDEAPDRLRAAHRAPADPDSPAPTFIHPFPAASGTETNARTLTTLAVR
ncbi:MAG: tannase/feruloyl esterase family alpha/beta hydrolase [Pseudomonadota bacterium]